MKTSRSALSASLSALLGLREAMFDQLHRARFERACSRAWFRLMPRKPSFADRILGVLMSP